MLKETSQHVHAVFAGALRHHRAGRPGEAERICQQVLAVDPRHAESLHLLGMIAFQKPRYDSAVDLITRAIAIDAQTASYHSNLGLVLRHLKRLDEAESSFRRALDINPDYPEAHNNLGLALEDKGLLDGAIACYRRALDLKPDYSQANNNLGFALKILGRFEEAFAALERAIYRGVDPCISYYGLSNCRKFTPADQNLVSDIMSVLQNPKISDAGRSLLHFALGKIFDDLAEYQIAIQHFDEGNRLGRGRHHADRAHYGTLVDWLIGAFPKQALRTLAASDSELPILIVGMPRSGTTLAEQILSSHPRVAAGGELDFWLHRANWIGKRPLSHLNAAAEQDVIRDYLGLLTSVSPDAMRITDKMPYNFPFLGIVHRLFPRARIIHCRRNPVDTALSIYFNRFPQGIDFTFSRNDIVFYYQAYARLMAHWRKMLPPDQFLEIDYERLVADQESVSRHMVEFCGLDWNETCLTFHETDRPIMTLSAWQVRQPIYGHSVERWRRYEPWLGEFRRLLS
jgi:tetratricopeptide (TPR) repeat protein